MTHALHIRHIQVMCLTCHVCLARQKIRKWTTIVFQQLCQHFSVACLTSNIASFFYEKYCLLVSPNKIKCLINEKVYRNIIKAPIQIVRKPKVVPSRLKQAHGIVLLYQTSANRRNLNLCARHHSLNHFFIGLTVSVPLNYHRLIT